MSKVQMLRGLVEQRLTAAAEEIFGLFERTIAEYEEELCRSKEENERQQKRLDAVFNPQLRLHRAELPQQHVCKEEEVLSDQQLNMPVITSVESEANSDHQLHRAESQDQKGGKHGDSGSTRNAEPEPKKRQRKSRSHINNVDNTNISEVHPNTQTELPQQHVCKEEEVLSDQQLCIQVRNSSLDRVDPEPPQIKEELCTSQEVEQLVLKQETDTFMLTPTYEERDHSEGQTLNLNPDDDDTLNAAEMESLANMPVITSVESEANSDPQLYSQDQKGDKHGDSGSTRNAEPEPKKRRRKIRSHSNNVDCGGQEPARNSDPDSPLQPATHEKTSDSPKSQTDDSAAWEENREPQTGLNPLPNNEEPVSDVGCNTGNTSVSSSECAGSFGRKKHLQKHSGDQTGGKPFSCSVCGKRYLQKKTLTTHMKLHSKEKCSTCPVCKASFCQPGNLDKHMRIHTGEKPFSCSICSKRFTQKQHLKPHLAVHKGEKPFSCSVCSKRFTQKQHLKQHLTSHTGEKPFSCSVCSKSYALKQHLKRHLTSHTGEKLFSCSVCDKRFAHKQHLNTHLPVHAVEKQFSCSVCSKRFTLKQSLKKHLRIHNGEK